MQVRRRARKEDESRRNEVCYPPREEDPRRRPARRQARVHPNVIDRHKDHYHATHEVQRCNAKHA